MSDDNKVVQSMIDFIEEEERNLQNDFYKSGTKTKKDMVKVILNKLEGELSDENTEN